MKVRDCDRRSFVKVKVAKLKFYLTTTSASAPTACSTTDDADWTTAESSFGIGSCEEVVAKQ